jgi:DNA-binding CsgD family transcriptional regulator
MEDGVGATHGPRSRISEERRQAALDAAARLQIRRSEIAATLARGGRCDARVVARTLSGTQLWIRAQIRDWHELWTVRPSGTMPHLRVSLPYNREVIAGGLRMISLWDWDGLKPEARRLLSGERLGRYLFGVGPVQMNIVDRRWVLLQGPFLDGEQTVMAVTDRECLAAAWRYWHAAVASSYPADEDEAGDLEILTPRQRQIAALLAVDTRDDAIAETLGVSVRTVRSDVAQLMEALGVRSRFAAGARFRESADTLGGS